MITQLCCAKEKSLCNILHIDGRDRNRLSELGFTKNTVLLDL